MIARVLTIAGVDPTGGAGIAQDLRTFHAFGVWGMVAVTALTVQDTTGVRSIHPVEPETLRAQIDAVCSDIGVDAAKTGMIPDARTVYEIARAADANAIDRLVVDPVLVASSGAPLTSNDTVFAIRELLLPRAALVTPNIGEAEALTGIVVTDRASQTDAARALCALGVGAALVTGGHLDATDVLASEHGIEAFEGTWIETKNTHGSGCVLSAAITACLARGDGLKEAIGQAKAFVRRALEDSLELGKGAGPVRPPQT